MKQEIQDLIAALASRNIPAFFAENGGEALKKVLSMIPRGSTVGFGDSLTLRQIGVVDALTDGDYVFLNPWKEGNSPEDNMRAKRQSLIADVFMTGTNALTMDGKIVNIDGHGNRVAAMVFGPGKVILVVGVNKIVKDVDEALDRIKNVAAPQNIQRHPQFDPPPPCGDTGECSDCNSSWRICNKTVIIEGQYDNNKYKPVIHVIIVGEELGL